MSFRKGDKLVRKLKIAGLACLCAAGISLTFCSRLRQGEEKGRVPEYVFTYAENQAEDYPTTLGAYKFAELVYERTDGRIEILVNAGAALGDERTVIEQMQFGGIDFARVSLSPLAGVIRKLDVLQMPYMYTSSEHMWKVLDGEIGDSFLNSFDGTGLVALSWYDAGSRNFYSSKKPIEKLEDMKGMKVRIQQSALMNRVIEVLGATPVQTAFDEVYSSFQTGEIDAAENNWASYESQHHYEVAGYFTLDEHTRVPELQLASSATWNKLSPEDQAIIRSCARDSAVYERQLWTERAKASEERVRSQGCVVIELSDQEKERFRDAMIPVYKEFCADYMDIVDAIAAAGR